MDTIDQKLIKIFGTCEIPKGSLCWRIAYYGEIEPKEPMCWFYVDPNSVCASAGHRVQTYKANRPIQLLLLFSLRWYQPGDCDPRHWSLLEHFGLDFASRGNTDVLENKNPEHFAPAMEQLKQRSIDGFFGPVERSATQLEICTNTLSCFDLVCEDDFGTFSTKYHCAQSVGSFSITFGDITGPLCWTEPQQQRFLHHDDSTEVCLNPFPAQVKRLLTQ